MGIALNKVCVIIPCYRDSATLARALDSVRAQTHPVDEIIVVNDNSPETEAIEAVLQAYPEVTYVKNPENVGLAATRNNGVRVAKSEIISFLDADDELHPQKIEFQLRKLCDKGAVACRVAKTTINTRPPVNLYSAKKIRTVKVNHTKRMRFGNHLTGASMMLEKSLFMSLGGYDANLRSCEDFDLWFRLLDAGVEVVDIQLPLYFYYYNECGLSKNYVNISHWELEVVKKFLQRNGICPGSFWSGGFVLFVWMARHFIRSKMPGNEILQDRIRENVSYLGMHWFWRVLMNFADRVGFWKLWARVDLKSRADSNAGRDCNVMNFSFAKIFNAGIWVGGLTALGYLGLMFRDILMARCFGVGEAVSLYQLGSVLPMFLASVLAGPVNATLVPEIVRRRTILSDRENSVWFSDVSRTIFLGMLLVSIFTFFSCLVYSLHREFAVNRGGYFVMLLLMSCAMLAMSGNVVLGNAALNSIGRARVASLAQAVVPVCAIIPLLLWSDSLGVISVGMGMLLGQLANFLIIKWILSGCGFPLEIGKPVRWKIVDKIAVRQYVAMVVMSICLFATPLIGTALAELIGHAAVSAYTLGSKVAVFCNGIVTVTLGFVVLPRFSRDISSGMDESARTLLRLAFSFLSIVSFVFVVALFFLSKNIVQLVFVGGAFLPSDVDVVSQVMSYSSLQLPFFAACMLLLNYALAQRRVGKIFITAFLGQILGVAMSFWFKDRYGVGGVTLGLAAGMALSSIMLLVDAVFSKNIEPLSAVRVICTWVGLALALLLFENGQPGLAVFAMAMALLGFVFETAWSIRMVLVSKRA
ncbi:Peptidoglycan biosynthesis protein MviN/MurJ, putative lipid II flippase [Formivibrio citricus]|uniref:Peptidoglycan biosynthesis protein MviN/MurJ, putative lipid II flippase n=1 Tax=Formivibrio citricus TaxID=83765 RepID=A0A1I4XX01_9NEIS|nr:Peptidoglycan biosynthesis protein MviN/MurJ, putative lipid II flippase [Formivibrio citricus]